MAPEHAVLALAPDARSTTSRHRLVGGTAGVAATLSAAAAGTVGVGAVGALGSDASGVIPCPFRALTGLPCPFCGMTHSMIALGEGDVSASLAAAPAAPLLVVAAAAVIIGVGSRGTRRGMSWPTWVTWACAGLLAAGWIAKIAFLGPT